MLFIILGFVTVVFGLMAIVFAIGGDKEGLKKRVGTENRGLAVALGIIGIVVGSGIIVFFL